MDRAGLGREARDARTRRQRRDLADHARHPLERPGEVHRRGARATAGDPAPRAIAAAKAGASPALGAGRQDQPVGRRDPDGRRPAHGERLDRLGDLLDAIEPLVALDERQRALVEQLDLAIARA